MSTASWKDTLKEVQKPLPHMGKTGKNSWCLGRIDGAIGEQKPACDVQLQNLQLQNVHVQAKWGSNTGETFMVGANIWGSLASLTSILMSTTAAMLESHRIAGFMIQPHPTQFLSSDYALLSMSFCCLASPGTLTWRCEPIWCPTREPGRAGNTCHSSRCCLY